MASDEPDDGGPRHAVVVATGADPPAGVLAELRATDLVVAADGGVDAAFTLGLTVDVAVGDFDSVSDVGLAAVQAAGARVERHPADKDATDLELAIASAVAAGVDSITVLAAGGGRFDHLLGVVHVIAAPRDDTVAVDAWVGGSRIHVVTPARPVVVSGTPKANVTLLAWNGTATGVYTEGLIWALRGDDLQPGGRGISNLFAGELAAVSVEHGTVVVVVPEEADDL